MPGRLEAVRLGQLRLAAEEDLLQARLDCGDHAGVAADGTVLAGQQPFRERRWALLALAQYRGGRQADALGSIRSARRALGQELGLDPGSELVALESRILAQDPGLATDQRRGWPSDRARGRAWRPTAPATATPSSGADADIAACLARLERSPAARRRPGPSGSRQVLAGAGRAGPGAGRRGRAGGGRSPRAPTARCAMAAARGSASAATRARHRPVRGDLHAGRGATFARPWLGELAPYAEEPAAGRARRPRATTWPTLGADAELRPAGRAGPAPRRRRSSGDRPARGHRRTGAQVAGLRLEPGLVDLLVRDAEGQPGALPLLSHALAETWQRRDGGLLTVDGYRAAGGIRGAVAASADRLYEGLTADERASCAG